MSTIYLDESPELRWFEEFSNCAECGKRANGILRGSRNESYGAHCTRCANKRLRNAEKARAKLKEQPNG